MFRVCEERFSRGIRDRLHARSPQQPAERATEAVVVIHDGHVDGFGVAHVEPVI